MEQIPFERELANRMEGRQFALLGVDTEPDQEVARKVMARERMTWPNWYDGAVAEGPICRRYHVTGFPSIFVLDARGVIRAKKALGKDLDRIVDNLLKEMEPAAGK
jgi:hypothetical protein